VRLVKVSIRDDNSFHTLPIVPLMARPPFSVMWGPNR
jgi:hypothetical protein